MRNTSFIARKNILSSFTDTDWFRKVFTPFLWTRLLLLLVGYSVYVFLFPHFANATFLPKNATMLSESWQMWRWFDSFWYLSITEHGYSAANALHSASNWVFYPLYPFSTYIVGRLLGGGDDAFIIAGVLISNGCALIALTYLYLLVDRDFGATIAKRTILYLIAFPTAFYFSAVYTESLWFVLTVASLYYTRKHQWGLGAFLGVLSALARPQGIGLVVPILWEFWQVVSNREKPLFFETGWSHFKAWWISRTCGMLSAARRGQNWLGLVSVCCIPLGTLAFFSYARLKTGDFFAVFDTERWGWNRQAIVPWMTIYHALQHPLPFSVMDYSAWPVSMAFILVFVLLLLVMVRKLPAIYTIYAAMMIFFPLSTGMINSVARYYLVIFPVQILLAYWSIKERRGILHWIIFSVCLLGECIGMASFVLGLPFIA